MQVRDERPRDPAPEDVLRERRDRGAIETGHSHTFDHRSPQQLAERRGQTAQRRRHVAVRHDEHDPLRPHSAGDELGQEQRGGVCLLGVVDGDDDGTLPRDPFEHLPHLGTHREAGLAGGGGRPGEQPG